MRRWATLSILAFGLLAHGSGQQAASADNEEPKEEPPGCLEATAHTSGPCKITYPNGNGMATLADGSTWIFVKKDYRFQVFSGIGDIPGGFRTSIITKIPQPADIIEAPQSEKILIYGECQSKTYQIWNVVFTDPNGYFSVDGGGPENVNRRVMPDLIFGKIQSKNWCWGA
jgi:hypothetical protein